MKVELLDLGEDLGKPLGEDDFSVDELNAFFVDFFLVGLDLFGDELAKHLDDVSVQFDRLLGATEALSLGIGKVMFRDSNHRVPVDALVEVVLKIVIVFEEIGHAYFSPSFST